MRELIIVVGVLVVLSGEVAMAKTVTCTMASLERTVELRYETPGDAVPCEVRYAKPTEGIGEQVLWRAEREAGYCEARFSEFVDKLTGFGWSCSASTGGAPSQSDDRDSEPEPDPEPAAPAEVLETTEDEAEQASEAATTE